MVTRVLTRVLHAPVVPQCIRGPSREGQASSDMLREEKAQAD
jgi:hypothetical protein